MYCEYCRQIIYEGLHTTGTATVGPIKGKLH